MLASAPAHINWADKLGADMAASAASSAQAAITTLLGAFGSSTEPDFGSIGLTYNRMLAVALLMLGAFIAMGLAEQVLGGPAGVGWTVIPRTVAAVFFAFAGLPLVSYFEHIAALLANTWQIDFVHLQTQLQHLSEQYQHPAATTKFPLGSALGLLFTALLTILIALLVYMELFMRVALILITTAFIPLISVMAVWPRLAGAASHLVEFLIGLLLSKFVIATAIFIGFDLVLPSLTGPGSTEGTWMVAGIAVLLIAAFSPVVLVQGLRFTHSTAGTVARGLAANAIVVNPVMGAMNSGTRLATRAIRPALNRLRPRAAKTPTPKRDVEDQR